MGQKAKLASVNAEALGLRAKLAADNAVILKEKAEAAGEGAGMLATKAELAAKNAESLGLQAKLAGAAAAEMATKAEASAAGWLTLGNAAKVVGAAWIGVQVALVAAVAATVPMAAAFQSATEMVHTQAGMAQSDIGKVRQGLLDMAPAVGIGPTELANGFYHVASAVTNLPPALRNVNDELKIFGEAAKLSKIGNAGLEQSTQAVIGVMAAYGSANYTATQAAAQLNAIVGAGDMRMEKLTAAMATGILPAAKTAGISLLDVGAALATLTDNVTPADEAATRLRMTFSMLSAPTGAAQKALAAIGINSTQLGYDMRKPDGLLVALTDLKSHLGHIDASALKGGIGEVKTELDHFGFSADQIDKMLSKLGPDAVEQSVILARAFGGGRSSAAVMTLLTEFDSFKDKYGAITAGANNWGDAWAQTTATAEFQWSRFTSQVQRGAIIIGATLLPIVTSGLQGLTDGLGKVAPVVARVWNALPAPLQATISPVVAAVSHVDQIQSGLGQLQRTATPLVQAIGAGMAAQPLSPTRGADLAGGPRSLTAGQQATVATQTALQKGGLDAAGASIGQFIAGALTALHQAWGWAVGVVKPLLDEVRVWWHQHGQEVMKVVNGALNELRRTFSQAMGGIMAVVGPALVAIRSWWKGHGDEVLMVLRATWNTIVEVISIFLPIILHLIGGAFQLIKDIVRLAWDLVIGVLRIAFDIVGGIFTVALDIITGHWDRAWTDLLAIFGNVWNDIKSLLGNVLGDLGGLLGDFVGIVAQLGGDIMGALARSFKDGANDVINVLNGLIGGLNQVLGNFGIHIPLVPLIGASGGGGAGLGMRVGSSHQGGMEVGGIFDRATAIVGEGSLAHPEWVIPTDPRHRGNAMGLLNSLLPALGLASGGCLSCGARHQMGAGAPGTTPGSWGGQCVTFAQNILGTYWPVSAANQLTAYVNSQMAVPGEAAVFTGGPFGHVAVVTGPGDGFCIAGGTPILTDRGEVPIELVEPGDRVRTRGGWNRVLWSGMTRRDAEVVAISAGGRELVVTPDHHVWMSRSLAVPEGSVVALVAAVDAASSGAGDQNSAPHAVRPDDASVLGSPLLALPLVDADAAPTPTAGGVGGLRSIWMARRTGVLVAVGERDYGGLADDAVRGLGSPDSEIRQQQIGYSPSLWRAASSPAPLGLVAWDLTDTFYDRSASDDGREPSHDVLIGHRQGGARDAMAHRLPAVKATLSLEEPSSPCDVDLGRHGSDFTRGQWVPAIQIGSGDTVWLTSPNMDIVPVTVTSVRPRPRVDTYDLTVEGDHEFFADRILVHNSFPVIDSNWVGPETIGTHVMSRSMYGFAGFINLGRPPNPAVLAASHASGFSLKGLVDSTLSPLEKTLATGWIGQLEKGVMDLLATGVKGALPFDQGGVLPPGLTLAYNGTGRGETVLGPGQQQQGQTINVYVTQPNASAHEIACEMAWALKTTN